MLIAKEEDGTLQRTVLVTIKPTPTEVADAIWNLNANEQAVLLCCLKRRFCNNEAGQRQKASVANALNIMPNEKSDEVKSFVRDLADYILEGVEL